MRFLDENIRLHIKDKQTSKDYKFKAYLEESKVQIKTLDTNIQYAPLNFTNNTQFLKTQYSVDFSFNVFAEDRDEAAQNYDDLHSLLSIVKPNYKFTNNQYLPMAGNIFGLIQIQFSGLPKLSKNDALDIYVTNFAYNINKDMGYLQMPYAPNSGSPDRSQLYIPGSNVLIPIAYRLDISGRVLLPLEESIRTQDKTNGVVANANKNTKSVQDILNSLTTDRNLQEKIMNTARTIVGDGLLNFSVSKIEIITKEVSEGLKFGYMTEKGDFAIDKNDQELTDAYLKLWLESIASIEKAAGIQYRPKY